MKHYKKRSLWALAMLILILYACVEEVAWRTPPENNSISVKEAQRFFNEHVQSFYLCGGKHARSAEEALLVTPLWEKGKNVLFRNRQMVEVPVYAPMTITKNLNAMQEDSARHVNTLYNLLAEKTEDGNILFTIAKVTCEIDCLKKIRGKRLKFHIGYDNLKEFSGTIRYYSLEGEFLTGFDYRNGRRIAIIESSKPYDPNKESSARRKATRGGYEHCWTDFIAEDVFYCYDVIIGGEVTKSECEYHHTDYYEETHCEWIDTGDKEEGDIAGGGGGEETAPALSNKLKSFFKGNKNLTQAQLEKLEEMLDEIADECSDNVIYHYLVDSRHGFNEVEMRPAGYGMAAYLPNNGNLVFYGEEYLTYSGLVHEMFHLYQHKYSGQYSSEQRGMMEYERKLYKDITYYVNVMHGDPSKDAKPEAWLNNGWKDEGGAKEYQNWLSEITKEGSTMPTSIPIEDFKKFALLFGQNSREYPESSGYAYDIDYAPSAINNALNLANINCK